MLDIAMADADNWITVVVVCIYIYNLGMRRSWKKVMYASAGVTGKFKWELENWKFQPPVGNLMWVISGGVCMYILSDNE